MLSFCNSGRRKKNKIVPCLRGKKNELPNNFTRLNEYLQSVTKYGICPVDSRYLGARIYPVNKKNNILIYSSAGGERISIVYLK